MSGAPKPPVIPEAFANDADPLYITAIPDTTGVAGRASYSLGFPPLTMQPVAGGGKPPFGQDVNGILFALSSHDFYIQAGQLFQWDTNVAAAIGGYAVGTILGSTDGRTVWFNTIDANSTDPDSGTAAGWVSLFSSGFQPFAGLTGGVLTLTATQAARKVITLSGVLSSNLAVVFPTWAAPAGRWLIINNTTGAFTITARTAAGTGVNVPQGGPSNPLEVYGDGTNIYPAVSPLVVPISQGADPLTLAERTNTGDVWARIFNMNFPVDNQPTTNVIYESGGDGYLRRKALVDFEASLTLSALIGQVTAGQVPLAAVIQYVTNILASAALTGIPTAPTAPTNTRTTQVATTQFVNPSASVAMPGNFKRASGHIVNYGFSAAGAVAFSTPFTNSSSYAVAFGPEASGPVQAWVVAGSRTNAGFTLNNTGGSTFWIAIGF
jgi:hypothetical protein